MEGSRYFNATRPLTVEGLETTTINVVYLLLESDSLLNFAGLRKIRAHL